MLYLANLPNELMRKHIYKLIQLLSDTQQHISYIVLPGCYCMRHTLVLLDYFFCQQLDAIKLFETWLVTFVDIVDLFLIYKAFDTCVLLFLLLPKVEGHAMISANHTLLSICVSACRGLIQRIVIICAATISHCIHPRSHCVHHCHHVLFILSIRNGTLRLLRAMLGEA